MKKTKTTFKEFVDYMVNDCGAAMDNEANGVECCECGGMIYEEDKNSNYDWDICPVCGYNIKDGA